MTGVPPTGSAVLEAVTVLTACSAWATSNTPTIERWDGANWTAQQVAVPSGGTDTEMPTVTATSATNVWAAGDYTPASASDNQPLIEHWNGTAWAVSPSPTFPSAAGVGFNDLSTSSAADAWTVGILESSQEGILTEHWDGRSWTQVPAPSPAAGATVDATGVADISPANAWMVGDFSGTSGTAGG